MRIRTLEPSDVELFYSFRLRGLRENPEAFGSTFAEESVMPAEVRRGRFHCTDENFVLGAFGEDGRLIGVAGFYRETHLKLRHKGFVWGMYVAPELRGRGVGRALLTSLIERSNPFRGWSNSAWTW